MPNVIKAMNLKVWKMGLVFALLMSGFQVLMNWNMVSKSDWSDIITFILTTVGAAGFGYMQKHPAEEITGTGNTQTFTKNSNETNTIPPAS